VEHSSLRATDARTPAKAEALASVIRQEFDHLPAVRSSFRIFDTRAHFSLVLFGRFDNSKEPALKIPAPDAVISEKTPGSGILQPAGCFLVGCVFDLQTELISTK
jgi:hypothetical protein